MNPFQNTRRFIDVTETRDRWIDRDPEMMIPKHVQKPDTRRPLETVAVGHRAAVLIGAMLIVVLIEALVFGMPGFLQ